jgi:uncharacterized protein (TIGR03067 family)
MKSGRWHAGGIAVLALWVIVALLRFQGPPKPAEVAGGPPPESPHRHLDGTWVVRSVRFDGTELPAAVVAAITFVFNDGLVTMTGGFAEDGDGYVPVVGERRYKAAVGAADPAGTIDLHPADTDRAGGGCVPGLYKLERGTLTLVLNFSGARPTSLDGDAESTGRFVCERRIPVE